MGNVQFKIGDVVRVNGRDYVIAEITYQDFWESRLAPIMQDFTRDGVLVPITKAFAGFLMPAALIFLQTGANRSACATP